jgi:hypothetical protein
MSTSNKTVFISYAHEDAELAERLYKDLKNVGLAPWRDKESIRAGENWKIVIRKAIKNSRYFIPLFSSKWVEKAKYIQKEIQYAIEYYDIYPESEISIIPARLDDCQIPFEKLEEIRYVDLFPDWNKGVSQMLVSMDIKIDEGMKIEDKRNEGGQKDKEEWRMGLSDKDWRDLLTSICKRKCIPFIGAGIYTIQAQNGKMLLPSTKTIVERWKKGKGEDIVPLKEEDIEDLYELARVFTQEDSFQLARLTQFLEIQTTDQMYPKNMLSELLKEINLVDFNSQFKNSSPYNILSNLDLPIYITTNYDKFLEFTISKSANKESKSELCRWNDNLSKYFRRFDVASIFEEQQYKPSTEEPLVYHILGDIDTPQSMVPSIAPYLSIHHLTWSM